MGFGCEVNRRMRKLRGIPQYIRKVVLGVWASPALAAGIMHEAMSHR